MTVFSSELRARLPAEADTFDQFERTIDAWVLRFKKARTAARYEERRFRETGLVTARRQTTHLAAALAVRLVDLCRGQVVLMNAGHPHPGYANARAIVETAAVFSYARQNFIPLLAKGRVERAEELLRRLRMGMDPGMGLDDPEEKDDPARPIPVGSMVKALCAQMDEVLVGDAEESPGGTMRRLYSSLSDHTHPNFSAGHISSSFDDEGFMDWSLEVQWTPELVHDLIGPAYLALHFAGAAFDEVLTALAAHRLILRDRRHG